jgi:hypothetical protein
MRFRAGLVTAALAAVAIGGSASAALQVTTLRYPEIDGAEMVRNVNTPQPTAWRPTEAEQQVPLNVFSSYRDALATDRTADAYAMFHDSYRANVSLADFASNTAGSWARGRIRITRQTWYPQPAGQPHHLYVAIDYISRLEDGSIACGYVMISRIGPSGADFRLNGGMDHLIEPSLVTDGLPRADVAAQIHCWLGDNVVTMLNS